MAEFQKVMREWSRMCVIPKSYGGICSSKQDGYICPMKSNGMCNKTLTDQTDADREKGEAIIMAWAAENPEPVYSTWVEWLRQIGVVPHDQKCFHDWLLKPIPADIAKKLGIEPKENN